MYIKYPKQVGFILNKLNEAGYSSYIVGGCVRDAILGITPKDWDITTDATPEQVKSVFTYVPGIFIVPTGEKYGTVTAVMDVDEFSQSQYEITTFRYDANYSDGRRPDKVVFGKSILDDLMRRDFTINAMAYNKHVGLVDPYNGQDDLNNRIIRCVENPYNRLREDALRILRGIRFACKYNFEIERSTLNAMLSDTPFILSNISKERIHEELIKILTYAKDNEKVINEFNNFWNNLFETKSKIDFYKLINNDLSINLKLFNIFKELNITLYDVEIWLRKYKFKNKDIIQILNYLKINNKADCYYSDYIDDPNTVIRLLLRDFPINDLLTYTDRVQEDDALNKEAIMKNKNKPYQIKHLKINGKDLIKLGFKQDKNLGDILQSLLTIVIYHPDYNNKEKLLQLAKDLRGI
jgi:tRNA nucleotidyltransferase (CCA-adding enzyme)